MLRSYVRPGSGLAALADLGGRSLGRVIAAIIPEAIRRAADDFSVTGWSCPADWRARASGD